MKYFALAFLFCFGLATQATSTAGVKALGYYSTPDANGPAEMISSIDKAKVHIRMWMFTMNNKRVVESLSAASARGVKVELILNFGMFAKSPDLIKKLQASGVKVIKSSPFFSITHAKTAIFDNSFALITTMNLTSAYRMTRDAGIRIEDAEVLSDLNNLFETDLANAKSGAGDTPSLKSEALVVSPVNAVARLVKFVDSAKSEILVQVENFTDGPLSERLIAAAQRGVTVKVMAPFCNLNENPFLNFTVLELLTKGTVHVRVPPSPASESSPYIHQKMILIDGARAFVGSENFTFNSMKKAREIGIIVDATKITKNIVRDFTADWNAAVSLPARPPAKCTVYGKNDPRADFWMP